MGRPLEIITDELYKKAKETLQHVKQETRIGLRLKAIVATKEQGLQVVSKVFGVTTETIRAWAKRFSAQGTEGLEYELGRGRKSKILPEHVERINEWRKENSTITLIEIVRRLAEDYEIKTSQSAVHNAMRKQGLSYIRPRPVHHQQNKSTHEEFKKKSTRKN